MRLNPRAIIFEKLVPSLFGKEAVKKLAINSAGYYAVVETVEIAADYNDWVKENEDFIINFASVAMIGSAFIRSGKVADLGSMLIRNPKTWIAGLTATAVYPAVEAMDFSFVESVELVDNVPERTFTVVWEGYGSTGPKPFVKVIIAKTQRKILFKSNVDGLGERLARLPVGGLSYLFDDTDEMAISNFAQSLAAESVATLASGDLSNLRRELQDMSAAKILTSQRSLLESMTRRYNYLTEDQIASEMQNSLMRVERTVGPVTFETGVTAEDLEYLLIGDKLFVIDEDKKLIFTDPLQHNLLPSHHASTANRYASLVVRFIQILKNSPEVPFFKSDDDDDVEITTPLSDSQYSLYLARVADANGSGKYAYHFVGSEVSSIDSFLETAKSLTNGIIDLTDDNLTSSIADVSSKSDMSLFVDSIGESFSNGIDSITSWFGDDEDSNTTRSSMGGLTTSGGGVANASSTEDAKEEDSKFVGNTPVKVESGSRLIKLLGF